MFNKYRRRENDNNFILVSFDKEDVKEGKKNLRGISREEYKKRIDDELRRIDDETINHLRKVDEEFGTQKAKEYEKICEEIKKKKKKIKRKNFFQSLISLVVEYFAIRP